MDQITVLFKRFQTAGLLSVAALALVAASPASAGTVTNYSDTASFLADIQSNYFLENFNSRGLGQITGPLTFSGNSYHYSADVPSDHLVYMTNGQTADANDHAISTYDPNVNLVFTFDAGINSVGGSFFATTDTGAVSAGKIKIVLNDGTTTVLNNPSVASFNGFISGGADISSITVSALTPAGVFATVDNLYVGKATIPEPSSVFLLLGGLVAGVMGIRRRNLGVKA